MRTVVFDLDGTLCDITHRLHHINGEKKDYDSFHKACLDDAPKHNIIKLFQSLCHTGYEMIIVSGRSDIVLDETQIWLNWHEIAYDRLIMRSNGDYTPDDKLKQKWLHCGAIAPKEEILFCVDDRQRVVDMWRAEGLTCLQIEAWGE